MSDNQRVYHAIAKTLRRLLKGKNQHHIEVLIAMITGLVRGKSAQLSKISAEVPSQAQSSSTVRRLQRFNANENVEVAEYYLPFANLILNALKRSTLKISMDASSTGRGCQVLMLGVTFKNRFLPLCWLVYEGKKGHTTAKRHVEALERLVPLIPEKAKVALLADGEYDNIEVFEWVTRQGWSYDIRATKSTLISLDEGKTYAPIHEVLDVEKDGMVAVKDVLFTKQGYGPVNVVALWEDGYDKPLYLITNIKSPDKACQLYRHRFQIETFFGDQKSRGFGIDKSHISEPKRLERLLLGACIAYLWMVCLGLFVLKQKCWYLIDTRRQEKSLFRLGIDWLKRLLNNGEPILVCFSLRGVM